MVSPRLMVSFCLLGSLCWGVGSGQAWLGKGAVSELCQGHAMTRQSPLRESQSLLVKWNCASWELRNRGPRVVWGRHGGSRVRAGQVLVAGAGKGGISPAAAAGSVA